MINGLQGIGRAAPLAIAYAIFAIPAASHGQIVEQESTDKPALLTSAPDIPAGAIPDEVGDGLTADLDGKIIEYTYSSERSYRLRFYDDRLTFVQLDRPGEPITLPYLARELENDVYMVHWMVPEREGHVALVLNFQTNKIAVSALMPGKSELFDSGIITRNEEAS